MGYVVGSLVMGLLAALGYAGWLALEYIAAFCKTLSEHQANIWSVVLFALLFIVGIAKPLGDAVMEYRAEKTRVIVSPKREVVSAFTKAG